MNDLFTIYVVHKFGATHCCPVVYWKKQEKHLTTILEWRVKKESFTLQKYLNRFDLHIAETLKKNF